MAELEKLQFVSDGTSVITVSPLNDCVLPVELTPTGGVTGQGTATRDIDSAIKEASEKATARGLPYIAPKFV